MGRYLFVLSLGLFWNNCSNNESTVDDITIDFSTGLNSQIYYGQGDCMPIVGGSNKKYSKFSGKGYIVNKRDYDNLIKINANCNCDITSKIDSLKSKSININILGGQLIMELQPDSFIIMIDAEYIFANDNIIYITNDSIVNTTFYFFNCTSF